MDHDQQLTIVKSVLPCEFRLPADFAGGLNPSQSLQIQLFVTNNPDPSPRRRPEVSAGN
jgi:hypothetical protein